MGAENTKKMKSALKTWGQKILRKLNQPLNHGGRNY
jgi:hypothetical protein